ncbi:MAG: hypothetical protein H7Y00_16625 [Fimbriimonadaceae bacterium]|nr:hypothetical protein [Chitinophagales bacterium]
MNLIYISVGFFLFAAMLGSRLLYAVLTDKPTPKLIVLLHGPIAITGLVLLIIFLSNTPSYYLTFAVVAFIVAACLGVYMLIRDMRRKPGPKSVALVHVLFALVGIICVAVFLFLI